MLRTIRKLLGEKGKQIRFPIALMGADAVLSIVLYIILYMTVIQLLNSTLTAGKIITYTAICFISVIVRLVIYRSAYYLCSVSYTHLCQTLDKLDAMSDADFEAQRFQLTDE